MVQCEEMKHLKVAKQSDKSAKRGFQKTENELVHPSKRVRYSVGR